jgi:hypothetical protein
MQIENYDQVRSWVLRPDIKTTHVFAWFSIKPAVWRFLCEFNPQPLKILHTPAAYGWSIGDAIPENFKGICRLTSLEERRGPAGNYRELRICEVIRKEDYERNISSVSNPVVYFVEFKNNGLLN